jgi:uncharacterized protein
VVRPVINRLVRGKPAVTYFKPQGIPMQELSEVNLTEDGLEALRLADFEGLYQDEAARRMGVSRPTFGRILSDARRIVAEAIIVGKAIRIHGGTIERVAQGKGMGRGHGRCRRGWNKR